MPKCFDAFCVVLVIMCNWYAGGNKHLHLYVSTQSSIAAFDVKTSSKVSSICTAIQSITTADVTPALSGASGPGHLYYIKRHTAA